MHARHLFEYAVIRVVPRVEREEFLNVGVVLYCRSQKFLGVQLTPHLQRVLLFAPALDCNEVARHLLSFQQISQAMPQAGPLAQLDAASRFRWLTATRSTVVQCSKVHPGLCLQPAQTLLQLFEALVL